MGIPKFFRWISERYPCLTEEIKEFQIPRFDNLYLDMNGIIHICSHPQDNDPHFRITEEQIFRDIFHYIEVLFRLIQPRKLFFMAVDGVAPRAKMNQQRGRRFSSAKAAETLEKKAIEKGEVLPQDARFDSNCITPGTEFMARLQEQLKYFVVKKISTDKTWRRPTVILSGHSVPGEGEHKIMEYIRYMKSQPDWDPSTRHCLYGLDADLIILGLSTHEFNFCLLREEVKFVKSNQKRSSTPETTNYVLFHLTLLRDYLDIEFGQLKDTLPFSYDLECIIDDWILMGFLVGNDFIPHLPHLHIANNALSLLFETYKEIIPTLDGYINVNGILHLGRLEKFLKALSQFDLDHFEETYADMKYFESKTGRSMRSEFNTSIGTDGKPKTADPELRALIAAAEIELFDFGDDTEGEALEEEGLETIRQYEGEDGVAALANNSESTFDKEFLLHKRDYYINKMEYPSVDSNTLRKEAEGYVIALQWVLHYYYRGCPSWGWYYPHHYAPYISDLSGFSGLDIEFDQGKPFLPFQQLLAVLPAASKQFLPKGFQTLMCHEDSPILDYYPPDFKVDMNGKRQEWEAVVLIPFIKEDRLLSAMQPHYPSLTEDERARNSHGPMQIYNYSPKCLGKYEAPQYFPVVLENHASVRNVWLRELVVSKDKMVIGPHPNASKAATQFRSGFPSLARIPFEGKLMKKGVKVFENQSRGENMILFVGHRKELESANAVMQEIAKRAGIIYVGWPHIVPAKVTKVVFKEGVGTIRVQNRVVVERGTKEERDDSERRLTSLKIRNIQRFGIDLGDIDGVIYANLLQEYIVSFNEQNDADISMKFAPYTSCFPVSTMVLDVQENKECPEGTEELPKTLEEYFPMGVVTFMVCHMYYGYQAKVIGYAEGRVRVHTTLTTEPNFDEIKKVMEQGRRLYLPGHAAANRLGISSYLLSRITGTIFVQSPHTDSDKTNLGLSLKFNKTGKEAVGLTKKEGNTWLYSETAIDLLREYMKKFPELFEYLSLNTDEAIFFKDQMFPGEEGSAKLNELKTWLKSVTDSVERRTFGSQGLEKEAVAALEELMAPYEECSIQEAKLRVQPHLLHVVKAEATPACPDVKADFQILDRVVYVRECHDIPLGLKGIIIGIEKKDNPLNENDDSHYIYDVFFDKEVVGGFAPPGSVSEAKRCYRLTKHVLINISYGERTYNTRKECSGLLQERVKKRQETFSVGSKCDMLMPSFSSNNAEGPQWEANNQTSGSVTNFFKACQNMNNKVTGPPQPRKVPMQDRVYKPVTVPNTQQANSQTQFSGFWNTLMAGRGVNQMQEAAFKPAHPFPRPFLQQQPVKLVNQEPNFPFKPSQHLPKPISQKNLSLGIKKNNPPKQVALKDASPVPLMDVNTQTTNINQQTEALKKLLNPQIPLPQEAKSKSPSAPVADTKSQTEYVSQQTEALKKLLRLSSAGESKLEDSNTSPKWNQPPMSQLSSAFLPHFNKLPENQSRSNNFPSRKPPINTQAVPNVESNQILSRTFYSSNLNEQSERSGVSTTKFVPLQVQKVEATRKATPPPAALCPNQLPSSTSTQMSKESSESETYRNHIPGPKSFQKDNSDNVSLVRGNQLSTSKSEPRRGGRRPRIAAKFQSPLNNP